jgi:DnaJ-class molecular chaperone
VLNCNVIFSLLIAQLALRLHPDKNKALHADEAFKLLSKAFSCLSNSDKRAYYDRWARQQQQQQ